MRIEGPGKQRVARRAFYQNWGLKIPSFDATRSTSCLRTAVRIGHILCKMRFGAWMSQVPSMNADGHLSCYSVNNS